MVWICVSIDQRDEISHEIKTKYEDVLKFVEVCELRNEYYQVYKGEKVEFKLITKVEEVA